MYVLELFIRPMYISTKSGTKKVQINANEAHSRRGIDVRRPFVAILLIE